VGLQVTRHLAKDSTAYYAHSRQNCAKKKRKKKKSNPGGWSPTQKSWFDQKRKPIIVTVIRFYKT
jgi:hypothetical protein